MKKIEPICITAFVAVAVAFLANLTVISCHDAMQAVTIKESVLAWLGCVSSGFLTVSLSGFVAFWCITLATEN
jgi:hypothetical protein